MRICLLNYDLAIGGAERQLLSILNGWPGDDNLCVTLLERRGAWLDETNGVPVFGCLGAKSTTPKMLKGLAIVPRLRQFFARNVCDVVVSFSDIPTLSAAVALRMLPRGHRPILMWSVQGDLEADFSIHRDGALRMALVRRFVPDTVRHYVAISGGVARRTARYLGISRGQISVIPNAVDLDASAKLVADDSEVLRRRAALRFVSVGRLHRAKGMDSLIGALAALAARGLSDWECFIVGDGPERRKLEMLITQFGLIGKVRLVGYSANPYAWVKSADIFVSPSRWETFGIAMAEAMALGVPVIATQTDGALDIIEPDVNGLTVPVGDTEAMASAIVELAKSPERRAALGERGRQTAAQFDAPKIAARYRELVHQIAGR